MPIPYRDQDVLDELGAAAYLKFEPDGQNACWGALFQINARGEPLEFTHNRVELPSALLWRGNDLHALALTRLTASLFDACANVPRFICCVASETPPNLFEVELRLDVPVLLVSSAVADAAGGELRLAWLPTPPKDGSLAWRLAETLRARQLLVEPFSRASLGLREVYSAGASAVST